MQALRTPPSDEGVDSSSDNAQTEQTEQALSIDDMRDLVGLAPTARPANDESQNEQSTAAQTVVVAETDGNASEALVDDDDFEEEEDVTTKRKPWQQGWPKVAIVAAPIGLFCLLIAIVLESLGGMELANTAETTEVVATVEGAEAATLTQQQEAEIARLKTSNALGNQASILDSQPTRRTEIRPTSPSPARVSDPNQIKQPQQPTQAAVAPKPVAQPAPTAQRARPVAVSRTPAAPAPRQPARRAEPAPVQTVRSQPVQTRALAPTPTPDPFEQWQKLAAVGSYGQVSDAINESLNLTGEAQPSEALEATPNDTIPVLVNNAGQRNRFPQETQVAVEESGPPRPRIMKDADDRERTVAEKATRKTSQRTTYEKAQPNQAFAIDSFEVEPSAPQAKEIAYWTTEEAASVESFEIAQATELVAQQDGYEAGVSYIMRNARPEVQPQATVLMPGISAVGEVITPVAWAKDIQSTDGAIELTEDLISNGSVVMPAGTQLTVALSEMSDSGMMRLTVTSIILPVSGYEHMQIPAEAISVQGAGGQVLMAKDISGVNGELRRLERNQALLGAIGTIGAVLNRPSSAVNTVGISGSSSSATYSSPNILGAVLEGGANTIVAQRAARNQQRAAELEQRPAVWVLEQGSNIEIFINQPVSIGH